MFYWAGRLKGNHYKLRLKLNICFREVAFSIYERSVSV